MKRLSPLMQDPGMQPESPDMMGQQGPMQIPPIDRALAKRIVDEASFRKVEPEQVIQDMVKEGRLDESTAMSLLRKGAGLLSSAVSAPVDFLANIPGTVVNLVSALADSPYGGHVQETFEDFPELLEKRQELFEKDIKQYRANQAEFREKTGLKLPEIPHFSFKEDIIKKVIPGEYIDPKTSREEAAQEFIGDVALFMSPFFGSGGIGLGSKLWRSIKSAAGGQAGKWIASNLGYDEGGQALGKVIGTVAGSVLGKGSLDKLGKTMMGEAEKDAEIIGEEIAANKRNIYKATNLLDEAIERGELEIDNKFQNHLNSMLTKDKITPKDLIGADDKARAFLSRNWKNLEATDKKAFSNYRKALDHEMKSLTDKGMPKSIYDKYYKGKELLQAGHNTSMIGSFFKENVPTKQMKSNLTLMLLLGKGARAILYPIAKGGFKVAQTLVDTPWKLYKYPAVRDAYQEVVKRIMTGSTNEAMKAVRRLDREVKKREKEVLRTRRAK
jgi:hypothetical protein